MRIKGNNKFLNNDDGCIKLENNKKNENEI